MLTEKCPYCGSYNDVQAGECYFCHKQLPDQPGKPKKKHSKTPGPQSVTFSSPATSLERKSPPGCLVFFSGILVFISIVVVFQWMNGVYKFIQWKIPVLPTDAGVYISYYLNGLGDKINTAIQYPIPVVVTIGMFLILCWGMLNLKKWARTIVLILLLMLLVGNFALFGNFVIHFYTTPVNVINFFFLLLGVLLNVYCVVWFFEHKRTFK